MLHFVWYKHPLKFFLNTIKKLSSKQQICIATYRNPSSPVWYVIITYNQCKFSEITRHLTDTYKTNSIKDYKCIIYFTIIETPV